MGLSQSTLHKKAAHCSKINNALKTFHAAKRRIQQTMPAILCFTYHHLATWIPQRILT